MSVFRIEKNKNYTAMSNYHFRDMNLSLKAVGLLSKMLSLPDNWDYSQAGLAKICKDGEDAIASALKELEKYGYLVRERTRDANGRMSSMLYHVYEVPRHLTEDEEPKPEVKQKEKKGSKSKKQTTSPQPDLPGRENPVMVKPVVDIPEQEEPEWDEPILEEQGQLNNNILNNNLLNTYVINQSINQEDMPKKDGLIDGTHIKKNTYEQARQEVLKIVNYEYFTTYSDYLEQQFEEDKITFEYYNEQLETYNIPTLNRIVNYMTDILASTSTDPIKIGNQMIDPQIVKAKLRQCNFIQVKEVIKQLRTTEIRNPKSYAISMLYNS